MTRTEIIGALVDIHGRMELDTYWEMTVLELEAELEQSLIDLNGEAH